MKKIIFGIKILILWSISLVILAQDENSIFSHSILKLPFEPKRDNAWSEVITSESQWVLFYSKLINENSFTTIDYVIPKIDFENYQVITGGLGDTLSLSDFLLIREVNELADVILITVVYNQLEPNCINVQFGHIINNMPNYPTITFLIKKTDKPIKFHLQRINNYECDN